DTKGNTKTIHLTVEGPVSVAGCTTQESIYEDNSNRSFLLYIDESAEQDQRIMNYQRFMSAGKINVQEQIESTGLLQNVQRLLKPIRVINPYAEYLELPQSVFKPRRTNSHYLQFIEAITFYKQYQREKKYDEQTGKEYIETTIEDIKEANELIIEVLLRKSDTITGACRNYLEELKKHLTVEKQTTFTALEIRRKLKVKKSTQWRYHQQLMDSYYIKKGKIKGENLNRYEVTNPNEYKELEETISKSLEECITKIERSNVPKRSTTKMERIIQSTTTSSTVSFTKSKTCNRVKKLKLQSRSHTASLISFKEWLDILGYSNGTVTYSTIFLQAFFYWLERIGHTTITSIT